LKAQRLEGALAWVVWATTPELGSYIIDLNSLEQLGKEVQV
jgi:hypothetical protein